MTGQQAPTDETMLSPCHCIRCRKPVCHWTWLQKVDGTTILLDSKIKGRTLELTTHRCVRTKDASVR